MKTFSWIRSKLCRQSGPATTLLVLVALLLQNEMSVCGEMDDSTRPQKMATSDVIDSCGPLALKTAMSVCGRQVSIEECAQLAETDPNGVTTLAGLQRAAQALGRSGISMHLTPAELALLRCPAILHVSLPGAQEHFVVYTHKTGGLFEVIDPTAQMAKIHVTGSQLELMWDGDCVVLSRHAKLKSLQAAIYRARGMLALVIGSAAGILVTALISRRLACFAEDCVTSLPSLTHKAVLLVPSVLGCFLMAMAAVGLCCLNGSELLRKDPSLVIGASTLDVGDLKWGESRATSIWVSNEGPDTLRFPENAIMSSCSCLSGTLLDSEMGEGEKCTLRIGLGSQRKVGPFKYSMYIHANDPTGGQVLTIRGRVNDVAGVVYPPGLYFGRLGEGENIEKYLSYVIRRPGIYIREIASDLPFVQCRFARADDDTFRLKVSLTATGHPGPFRGTLTIETNDSHPDGKKIEVPFSGFIEPLPLGRGTSQGLHSTTGPRSMNW